ncbi:Cu-Zn family superoxide dismutase [Gelidibacter sediminis]|uniref:Superoxide dismutase [Cu-Zn] n=1 Tax=Gelidibacter sediminis TaxID=1608710 RepID=A0A4R7PYZ0_9FLAO|nr:superoxide dismutase family protein [Gelidibacter sediminis]TDU39642.1 Cu-Zn family superoxide dismutase [Gelidibacter sediminis]
MKRLSFIFIAVFALTMTTSCKKDKKETKTEVIEEIEETKTVDIKKMQVALEPKSGSTVKGNAVFTEEDGTVTMVAVVGGLKEGEHAIHLHEKADCSADDGTSSGGHWNPTNQPHGKWGSPDGYHKGDIGNFKADANGNGTITVTTDEWCIGCGDANKDIVGKAIIIHEGVDDFKTQPTGNAGGRVSCGGIIK